MKNLRTTWFAFFILTLALCFQNCSPGKFGGGSSLASGGGNGESYDGLTRYFYLDQANACSQVDASGQPLPNAEIDLSNQSAELVRNNCLALNPPQSLPMSQLRPTNDGTGDIIYNSQTFVPQAFYVASTGSDANNGTSISSPFLTLARAQTAMQVSGILTTYVRAGTYNMGSTLTLTAQDSGERWSYYLPDGLNSAVLDGAGSIDLILISGGSNITISGLKLQNFKAFGVHSQGGSSFNVAATSGNTIMNCDIGFNTTSSGNSGAVFTEGASPNTVLKNNYIHDLGGHGLALISWFSANDSIDGSQITGNVILNTGQRMNQSGGIITDMRMGSISAVTITNNFVRDYSGSGISGNGGITLDENSSTVTVSGNIVGPPGPVGTGAPGATAIGVVNGHDNHITGNIVDVGGTGLTFAGFWDHLSSLTYDAGMAGNTFISNVIIFGFSGAQNTNGGSNNGFTYWQNMPAADFNIQNNVYYNYAGGQVFSNGVVVSDSKPLNEDALLSGWNYQITAGSPVFASPVNFQPIVGGWGPPGFAIPQSGTAPSSPH